MYRTASHAADFGIMPQGDGSFRPDWSRVEQRTTGNGRRIDVSLLEATLAAMGWVVSNHLNAGVVSRCGK